MPSFSESVFGHDVFGKWPWSRQVLFDYLPGLYREEDANQGHVLELWTEGLRPSFDLLAEKIADWWTLRDPLSVRTQYNASSLISLGLIKTPEAPVEQRGVDGKIDANRNFSAPTARFNSADLGKRLVLSGSSISINNRTFKIAAVVGTSVVTCDPPLFVDAGPLTWQVQDAPQLPDGVIAIEVRGGDVSKVTPGWTLYDGSAQLPIYARQQFFPISGQAKSLTLREGSQGVALADGRFQAETPFIQQDVGKPLTLSGGTQGFNAGKYNIFFVDASSPSIVQLHAPITLAGADLNGGVAYTLQLGTANVQVRHVVEGINTPLSVVAGSNSVTVYLQTNGSGVPISTAAQVSAVVNASITASALLAATFTGTGASLAGVYDYQTVPGVRLLQDSGPLVWALLPFPQLELVATSPPLGIIEQEGTDMVGGALPNEFLSSSAKFTTDDIGKMLVVRGSLIGNDGRYTITGVANLNQIAVTPVPAAPLDINLTWEVRVASKYGDLTQVQVFAPSLIQYLAQDFGIEIDFHESEARQRSWVENVSQWIDLKGLARAYQIIGNISGFNVTVSALYRIGTAVAAALPLTDVYYVGETDTGRHGLDGRLLTVGTLVRFTAASAAFRAADVGVCLKLQNCATFGNDKTYTIASFIDAHTVEFLATDTAVTPDNGVAGTLIAPTIQWSLVRLYTTLAPTRPLFDDVNVELMQYIVGTNHFLVDTYCWDAALINSFNVDITATTPTSSAGVPITFDITVSGVTLPGPIYTNCGVIGAIGRWKLIDGSGTPFYVESLPVQVAAGPPPVHTFQVFSSVVPTLGTAVLSYECAPQESCDYCKASKVLAIIEEGSILGEHGIAVEKVLERVLSRENTEVRPVHVELVPIFRRVLTASLSLSASIEADQEIYAVIIAPLTYYFDIIPGDVIITDLPMLGAGP